VDFPIEAPRPARIGAGNFLEKRKEHCFSKEWAGLMIENPIMRNLYRMYTPDVDLDVDLLACAAKLHADDQARVFYLKMIWRVLMQNYAIPEGLKVGKLLRCSGERLRWSVWRVIQGYSLPRLWVALIIGYVPLFGSDRLRRLIAGLAAQSSPRNIAFSAICIFIFYLGMTDVQRRVGRSWRRVLLRSLILFLYGVVYAGAAWGVHCSGWLTGRPADPHYALLLAACALMLGHMVQLFWTDNSVSDPL